MRKKKGGTDLFGRMWWDRPAFTIRTEFFKPEKGRYLHPEQHRPITHREAARIQSFPDWFEFKGSKIEIARQIGNAVPPRLAESIALSVLQLLVGEEELEELTFVNQAHVKGGANLAENLAVLCNTCHDDLHKLDKKNEWTIEVFQSWVNG